MGGIISIVILLVMVTAQSSLFNIITLDGAVPDLSLVFLVLLSLKHSKYQTYILAIWAGLLQDVLFYPVVGVSIAAKLFVTYILINFVKKDMKENFYSAMLLMVFSVLVHEITMYIFFSLIHLTTLPLMWHMQHKIVPYLIYNLVFALILYKPLNKFYNNRNFYEI